MDKNITSATIVTNEQFQNKCLPLYGHRSGKHMKTHWMAFLKE